LLYFFLCPVLCLAEVAGTWEGVLKFPLARSAGVPRTPPDTTSNVTDGRYHNDWTGIEFSVPEKFTYIETETRSNPGGLQADFTIPGIKNARVGVWMNQRRLRPENPGQDSAARWASGGLYDCAK